MMPGVKNKCEGEMCNGSENVKNSRITGKPNKTRQSDRFNGKILIHLDLRTLELKGYCGWYFFLLPDIQCNNKSIW